MFANLAASLRKLVPAFSLLGLGACAQPADESELNASLAASRRCSDSAEGMPCFLGEIDSVGPQRSSRRAPAES